MCLQRSFLSHWTGSLMTWIKATYFMRTWSFGLSFDDSTRKKIHFNEIFRCWFGVRTAILYAELYIWKIMMNKNSIPGKHTLFSFTRPILLQSSKKCANKSKAAMVLILFRLMCLSLNNQQTRFNLTRFQSALIDSLLLNLQSILTQPIKAR